MLGHLEVIRYEPEPLESGWWAVRDEPLLEPVYVWVEDDDALSVLADATQEAS